jgi:rod shape determining protein RodA
VGAQATNLRTAVKRVRVGRAREFDPHILVVLVILIMLGLITLRYSSPFGDYEFKKQVLFSFLGFALFFGFTFLDYRELNHYALPIYLVALVALLGVRIVGHSSLGATRWISIAGFTFQPSEVSKLILIIALASFIASRSDKMHKLSSYVLALFAVAPLFFFVYIQPDLSTALLLVLITAGMLFLGGASKWQLGLTVLGGLASIPLALHFLHGYQRERLIVFLHPSSDPLGAGYNITQAKIAIGDGGLFGDGFRATQGMLGYLPSSDTDFIFAIFAQMFGFVGAGLLLILYGYLIWRLIRAAVLVRDKFGQMLLYGIATMFFVEVVVNIGMNIGIMPVAGIPLPFFSYGGSALVTDFAALGVAESVIVRKKPLVF